MLFHILFVYVCVYLGMCCIIIYMLRVCGGGFAVVGICVICVLMCVCVCVFA